jgi:hypothetical protein
MPLLPLLAARPALSAVPGLGVTARWAAAPVQRWSVASQWTARRNAMVASTALARRRAEREEAEAVVATAWVTPRAEARRPAAGPAPALPVAHG